MESIDGKFNNDLRRYARDLRNNSTLGEIILWKRVLKAGKMLGFQFNRQFVIENFIVDFICRKLKLIIEVDGYSHNYKYDKDIKRDNKLNSLGYTIIRFSEQQVRKDLDNVVRAIENIIYEIALNEPIPPAPFAKGE